MDLQNIFEHYEVRVFAHYCTPWFIQFGPCTFITGENVHHKEGLESGRIGTSRFHGSAFEVPPVDGFGLSRPSGIQEHRTQRLTHRNMPARWFVAILTVLSGRLIFQPPALSLCQLNLNRYGSGYGVEHR